MSDKFTLWEAVQSGQAGAAFAGILGGVVYVATSKNLDARDSVAAVLTGGILAAYIAPVVGDWINADTSMMSLLGLVIGVAGMGIGPTLAKGGETLARAMLKRMGADIAKPKDNQNDTDY